MTRKEKLKDLLLTYLLKLRLKLLDELNAIDEFMDEVEKRL